jgi:hypothetical protein
MLSAPCAHNLSIVMLEPIHWYESLSLSAPKRHALTLHLRFNSSPFDSAGSKVGKIEKLAITDPQHDVKGSAKAQLT